MLRTGCAVKTFLARARTFGQSTDTYRGYLELAESTLVFGKVRLIALGAVTTGRHSSTYTWRLETDKRDIDELKGHTTKKQTNRWHTSCSQPVRLEYVHGPEDTRTNELPYQASHKGDDSQAY